jgi:heme-degrading monooxygenase HmoA
MKDYRRTRGNKAAYILRRQDGDRTEFITLTFWDSIDSVKAFAGEQYGRAVFYDQDDHYLIAREETTPTLRDHRSELTDQPCQSRGTLSRGKRFRMLASRAFLLDKF